MFSKAEIDAVSLSFQVAGTAIALSLPLAVIVALYLARRRSVTAHIINIIVHLPLVLPPVVTGYVLLLLFGRNGPLGAILEQILGLSIAFRWTGAAVAAAVMAFPLFVRPIRLAFELVDPKLQEASQTLGANKLLSFLLITLPLALPGIIAGMVLAFAKALGEFGATITFVSNIPGETQTVPLAIYNSLQIPDGETAVLRLAFLALAVSIGALAIAETATGFFAKKLGLTRA